MSQDIILHRKSGVSDDGLALGPIVMGPSSVQHIYRESSPTVYMKDKGEKYDDEDEENVPQSRRSFPEPAKSVILEVSAEHYDDEEEAKDAIIDCNTIKLYVAQ